MLLRDAFAQITDPYFYAVTIPAVLLLGIFLTGIKLLSDAVR